jgi:DNA-binding PadR family transcriptional regulator
MRYWFLNRPAVLKFVAVLYKAGGMASAGTLRTVGGLSHGSIEYAGNVLEKLGLVKSTYVKKSKVFVLTDKGRRVAEYIEKIADLLSPDEVPGFI